MAASLGIGRVIVPPAPGLFSSFGLLYADVEHHYSRTFRRLLRQADLGEIDARLGRAGAAGGRPARGRGLCRHATPGCCARRRCTTRGRASISWCPVPDGPIDAAMVAHLEEAFGREHERTYGHRAGAGRSRSSWCRSRSSAEGLREFRACRRHVVSEPRRRATQDLRARAYFGAAHGWIDTPVLKRSELATSRSGPVIVEEYDATCVIPRRRRLDAGWASSSGWVMRDPLSRSSAGRG